MSDAPCDGRIVTFYSYKGGAGRSMAVANVAWILATNKKRVLAIDWDLEAPGLHRYFAPFLTDAQLVSSEGIIEFVLDYAAEALTPADGHVTPAGDGPSSGSELWYAPWVDLTRYAVSLDWDFPEPGTLDFVPAGCQGPFYGDRVRSFNWQNFYDRLGGGAFLEAVRRKIREEYDYVLIDSRTGLSDTAGICTVQLPDTLVVCFTANNQAIEGSAAVAASVWAQSSDGPKPRGPARILPVLTRVDESEKTKLGRRQQYAHDQFSRLVTEFAPLRNDQQKYWKEMQVPYIPFYSYEETLACFGDQPRKVGDLLSSMERLTNYITDGAIQQFGNLPAEMTRQRILAVYEGRNAPDEPQSRVSIVREPQGMTPGPVTDTSLRAASGSTRYDAYLSYSSQDGPIVMELAQRLRQEGLALYLDEWELAPGKQFQPALSEALRDSKSCVVFLGRNGLAPWQKQEILVAIDRRTHDDAFRVIPVLLPGTERPRRGDVAHLEFLINVSWVEFLRTIDDEQAFRSLVWGITGTRPAGLASSYEGMRPYRGLEPFRFDDAQFFFGRENLTGWLVSALRREVMSARGVRFLGVLGPSGSGKSSVVLAGLVPKLNAGAIESSERWPVAIVRPGDKPLKNLASGVVSSLQTPGTTPDPSITIKLIEVLREEQDAQVLHLFVQHALRDLPKDVRLVVVIDQFEELFTYRPEDSTVRQQFEKDRDTYLANLLNAAASPGGRVAVVLTMRSDFLGTCATFPQLSAVLSSHQELVGPMTLAELREVIVEPAYLVGHEVEPALVERLLSDVKGQTGALPLLQFALTELWKKRDTRRLTLRAYEELGKDIQGTPRGIEGALEHRAEEIYRGLSSSDQDLCRHIFLRLVQPGEGTEDTKRRVSFRELLPADPERAKAVQKLIYTLSEREARLITTEGDESSEGWVEVAHEALIQGWTRLRQWVDIDRAGLRTQRRLTDAAREWAVAKSEDKDGYLYSGAPLAVSREWVRLHADELGSAEAEFLAASEQAERQREQDALENERRLRGSAEAAAARQSRLGYRLLVTASVAGVLAITSCALAVWANKARNDAEAALAKLDDASREELRNQQRAITLANLADSRRIAYLSASERDKHLDRAVLLAVEALRIDDSIEARSSLFDALLKRPEITSFLHTPEPNSLSVVFSPDGKTLAAGYASATSGRGGVVLWEVASRELKADLSLITAEGGAASVAFSPDGKTLATGYKGGSVAGGVVLWDVDRRERLADKSLDIAEAGVESVAFSPDGKTLAAGYGGRSVAGGVVFWDVSRRQWLAAKPLTVAEGGVESVAFSPDGKTLAAGYASAADGRGGVVLWDVARHERLGNKSLVVTEAGVESVAFSHVVGTLAAASGHGVVLWDVDNRNWVAERRLAVEDGLVRSVAFAPDGKTLGAGYSGAAGKGGVVLWNLGRSERLLSDPLTIANGEPQSVAFDAGGKTIAVAYRGGAAGGVVLWNVDLKSWLEQAEKFATRNLSHREWRQYFPDRPYRATFADLPVPIE